MKRGKGITRRCLSVLLALAMCLGMLPGTVWASDADSTSQSTDEHLYMLMSDSTGREKSTEILSSGFRTNRAANGPSVQVWTDLDNPPSTTEDFTGKGKWGYGVDAPAGTDLWYRVFDPGANRSNQGVLSLLGAAQPLWPRLVKFLSRFRLLGSSVSGSESGNTSDSRAMIVQHNLGIAHDMDSDLFSFLTDRLDPDYSSVRVWQDKAEVPGDHWRLYEKDFRMYPEEFTMEGQADISAAWAARNRIQDTWSPYYTFGILLDHDLLRAETVRRLNVAVEKVEAESTADVYTYKITLRNTGSESLHNLRVADYMDAPLSLQADSVKCSVKRFVSNSGLSGLAQADSSMGGALSLVDGDGSTGTAITAADRLQVLDGFKSGVPEPERDANGRIVWDGTDWSWLPKDGASGGTKNRIVWRIVYLNPGEEFTITYSCGVSGGTSGEPDNRVDVLGVDTVGLYGLSSELKVDKAAVAVGESFRYTFNVANMSEWESNGVTATVTIPVAMGDVINDASPAYVSSEPVMSTSEADSESKVIGTAFKWEIGSIPAGESRTVSFSVSIEKPGTWGVPQLSLSSTNNWPHEVTDEKARELSELAMDSASVHDGAAAFPDLPKEKSPVVITFKARLGADGIFAADDAAEWCINAKGGIYHFEMQNITAVCGDSGLSDEDVDALINRASGDSGELPPFDMYPVVEDFDVPALERLYADASGPDSSGIVIASSASCGASFCPAMTYGFDVVRLDKDGKIMDGGEVEIRTVPGDPATALAFVRESWMDGSGGRPVTPEGPVYRLAVEEDDPAVRVTALPAGKVSVVGLRSGTYYVIDRSAPAGYLRSPSSIKVDVLSYAAELVLNTMSAESSIRDTDIAGEMVGYTKNDVLAQAGTSMAGNGDTGGTSTGSGYKINRAADDAAGLAISESMRSQIRGLSNGWSMLAPIQVDGGGTYDLYDFGYGLPRCGCAEGKCTCARSGCQCGEDKCKCTKDHCACLEEPCGCSGAELLCVPAMAFFDSDDGGYTYGVTRSPGSAKDDPKPFVLQIGSSKDAKIEATAASPLKGGVVVRNEPGSEFELPKTGGAGTAPYVVSGFTMALLAGLILAARKKRR